MQGNNLVSHDIVAVFNVLGDVHDVVGVGLHLILKKPLETALGLLAGLLNLEKAQLGRVDLVGSLAGGDLGHVRNQGTHLMGPELVNVLDPLQRHLGAGSDRSDDGTGLGVETARLARAFGVLVRVDGRDTADGRLGVRLAWNTAHVLFAITDDLLDIAVGIDTDRSEREKRDERREQHSSRCKFDEGINSVVQRVLTIRSVANRKESVAD